MRRQRIKTLAEAMFRVIDVEFEKGNTELFDPIIRAREIQLRELILDTLGNTSLKGKRLEDAVRTNIEELVRFRRSH